MNRLLNKSKYQIIHSRLQSNATTGNGMMRSLMDFRYNKNKLPTKAKNFIRQLFTSSSGNSKRTPYTTTLHEPSCTKKAQSTLIDTQNQKNKDGGSSIYQPMINPDRGLNCFELPQISPVTHSTFQKEEKHLPAITTILKDTMPAEAAYILQKWRQSMIRKLGEEGFNQFTADTFSRGKKLHSMVEHFFLGKEPQVNSSDEAQNLWKSIEGILNERVSNVRLVEHTVTHSEMGYRGIVDAVAYFDNNLTVIDFKTTVKQKISDVALYDSPLQVSAYCGALNHDPQFAKNILGSNITSGVLIYAYTNGSPASVHIFDSKKLERYWAEWCIRLNRYQNMVKYKEQQ